VTVYLTDKAKWENDVTTKSVYVDFEHSSMKRMYMFPYSMSIILAQKTGTQFREFKLLFVFRTRIIVLIEQICTQIYFNITTIAREQIIANT
jgi:hypothetical protein